MGIWSYPITAVCYTKDKKEIESETVKLDFTNVEKESIIKDLGNHNIIVEGITTFYNSIMTACDTAKIWGYFSDRELRSWNAYFDLLFKQNKKVNNAHAHFFCADYEFPYIISKEKDEEIKIYSCERHNVLYTKLNIECDLDEDTPFNFDIEEYKKALYKYPEIFWMELTTERYDSMMFNEKNLNNLKSF
jgi:hypothetical protein